MMSENRMSKRKKVVAERRRERSNNPVLRGSLHSEVERGSIHTAKALLSRGFSANTSDALESTLLHEASINGDYSMVKLLLKHEAKVDAKDYLGMTPLHAAAVAGHLQVFKLLLHSLGKNNKRKVRNINIRANGNLTPLHFAALNGHLDLIKYIIRNGGNIEAVGNRYHTPVHYAFFGCQPESFRELTMHIKNFSELHHYQGLLNLASSANRFTHIDYNKFKRRRANKQVQVKYSEIIETILAAGSTLDTNFNVTVLHNAAAKAIPRVVELLLNFGADANRESNIGGFLPIHCMALLGNYEALSLLINAGTDINAKTPCGRTIIDLIESFYTTKDIFYLYAILKYGFNVNAHHGHYTPLFVLVLSYDNRDLPCILLDWFLDFNAINYEGLTPLQYMIQKSETAEQVGAIIKTIVKMEIGQNFKISTSNMATIISKSYLMEFYNKCKKELETVKKIKVSYEVGFFDLLNKPLEKIREYCRKDEFLNFINSGVLKSFPIYGGWMESRIRFAIKLRDLRIKSCIPLRQIFYPKNLSHIIAERILDYLNVDEMEKLSSV